MESNLALGIEVEEEGSHECSLPSDAVLDLAPRGQAGLSSEAHESFQAGIECLSHGDAADARSSFEKVVAAHPGFADGHIGLGVAHALEHQVYPALKHLEKATELDPASFHAHFKLGQFYFLLRVPQKGYQEMERALPLAGSLDERRLVAQLLRDERQREKNSVARPTWYKPFSLRAILAGFGLVTLMTCLIVGVLHYVL